MLIASLVLNILVLIPFCTVLMINTPKVQVVAGPATPGRSILLAIYLSILIGSIFLLFSNDINFATALLSLQIIYKLITPITVGSVKNPIVVSNIFIAIFHSFTLYSLHF